MKTIKNFFVGIILGVLFIIIGVFVLFFNERNNVKNMKSVSEARDKLVLTEPTPIKSENEGALVTLSGKLSYNNEDLYDSFFGVHSGKKTYKMQRFVEMYQWKEESSGDDKDKKLYKKVWSSSIINSDLFDDASHVNPSSVPYDSLTIYADNVRLGDYAISSDNLKQVFTDEDVLIEDASLPFGYSLQNNYITNSGDINSPEVGDIRISYKMIDSNDFSIVAMQSGNKLVDYVSKQGKTIHLSSTGIVSGNELINKLESGNNVLKWILRIVGIVLISFGFAGLISPINKVLNFVPIVGNKISGIISLMALLVGVGVSLIIIGVSWVIYRPIIGILLLVSAALFMYGVVHLIKKNKDPKLIESSVQNSINSNIDVVSKTTEQILDMNNQFNKNDNSKTFSSSTSSANQEVPLQPWEQVSNLNQNFDGDSTVQNGGTKG